MLHSGAPCSAMLRHALRHASPVDAFHARAGTAFFRVNGSSPVGVGWRLLVVGATMTIGLLAGLKPAIAAGSALGIVQTLLIWLIQVVLGVLCFCVSPDADRIFYGLDDAAPSTPPPEGYTYTLGRDRLSELFAFANVTGVRIVFGLNGGPGPRYRDGRWV